MVKFVMLLGWYWLDVGFVMYWVVVVVVVW